MTGILPPSPFSGQVRYRAAFVVGCEIFRERVVGYLESELGKDISSD